MRKETMWCIALMLMFAFAAEAQQRAACLAPTCDPNGYMVGSQFYGSIKDAANALFGPNNLYCETISGHVARLGPVLPEEGLNCSFPGFQYDMSQYVSTQACAAGGAALSAQATTAATGPGAGHYQAVVVLNDAIPLTLHSNSIKPEGVGGDFPGWSWTYGLGLGWDPKDPTHAYAHRANGDVLRFTLDTATWSGTSDSGTETIRWAGMWVVTNAAEVEEWYSYIDGIAVSKVRWLWNYKDVRIEIASSGDTTRVWDQQDRVLTLKRDVWGRIVEAITPKGHVISFVYDGPNLERIVYASGRTDWFGYVAGNGIGKWGYGSATWTSGAVPTKALLANVWEDNTLLRANHYVNGRSTPDPNATGYMWQANEMVAAVFIPFSLRGITPPPATGTRHITQPARDEAMPVPSGSRPEERPWNRPARPGTLLSEPYAPASEIRFERCKAAAQRCLNALNPGIEVDDYLPGWSDGGNCPAPEPSEDGSQCLWTFVKCIQSGERIVFPDSDSNVVDAVN